MLSRLVYYAPLIIERKCVIKILTCDKRLADMVLHLIVWSLAWPQFGGDARIEKNIEGADDPAPVVWAESDEDDGLQFIEELLKSSRGDEQGRTIPRTFITKAADIDRSCKGDAQM